MVGKQRAAAACRTSVISMSLKTGIVGLPNVGKVNLLKYPSQERLLLILCSEWHAGEFPPESFSPLQSTLFNAICENGKAQAANFPFCTIEPNVGIVAVPDHRLEVLSNISKSKAIVPTSVEFVDIAGLVKGASKGEGLGNQFLANIRECDALAQVNHTIHICGKCCCSSGCNVILSRSLMPALLNVTYGAGGQVF